ncbi:MAG: STAS domain-containing protein [Acidimicrobiia bacterium]|nr:STAS domain-containing protein [Acidimicrobiia bacterium]
MGELRLTVSESDGVWVVEVYGELDMHTSPDLRDQLVALIDSGANDIVLDLSGLEFIDSTGLGVLVGILKRLVTRDGRLVLRSPRPAARRVFEITGLDLVFDIVD